VAYSVSYRASNTLQPGQSPNDPELQFTHEHISLPANEDAGFELGELAFKFAFHSSENEGRSFSVLVKADTQPVFQSLYQFGRNKMPKNQFIGDHGFTGLIYLTHPEQGGDYQFICSSNR